MSLNALCRAGTHDWQPTSSPLYLKCQRPYCRAVKRIDGKDIVVKQASAKKEQAKCPEQSTFME